MRTLLNLILCFSIAAGSMQAQDIATTSLTWKVNQLKDLNTTASMPYMCSFNTGGGNQIEWLQKNNFNTTLTVTGTTGTWANVSATGEKVYSISIDGEPGKLTFEKDATGTYITLDLSQGGGKHLKHRYTVAKVE